MAEEDNPFESPRLLLAGATRHIETFEARLIQLRNESSNWCTPEADPSEPGATILKASVAVPPEMKQIVFDITNNLRSALDHAVFAGTFELTGRELDKTKFPFGDTEKDARDDAKRRCRDVPSELVDFLLALKPHRSGNPLLYGLNKLRNTKSHRVLIPFAAQPTIAGMGEPTPGTSVAHEWDPSTGRFKASLHLAPEVEGGAVIFNFRLELLIGTGALRGEPALRLFNRMLGEVERVVSAIEAETARLLRERSS